MIGVVLYIAAWIFCPPILALAAVRVWEWLTGGAHDAL